jgi:hypothetical protein
MKFKSPFHHQSSLIAKSSRILSVLIGGSSLLFASSVVYGFQSGEIQKITTQPLALRFEEMNRDMEYRQELEVEKEQERKKRLEKAKLYLENQKKVQEQQRVKQQQQQVNRVNVKQTRPVQNNFDYSYQRQDSGSSGNTTGGFDSNNFEWAEEKSRQSQADQEAFKQQADQKMADFEAESQAGLEAFRAEAEARSQAFREEHGIE